MALCGILLSLPLMAVIAFLIRCSSRGPVLFRQVRLGQGMEPFILYKFRTMRRTAPRNCPSAQLYAPACHITPFGAFLRKTSLDELPQLWNVLRGEMSLVGPRPIIPAEGELVTRRACVGAYRVKPGISGLSQVRGRDLLNDEDKARLDGEYARHLSPWKDAGILLQTALAVALHRGIREGGDIHALQREKGKEGGTTFV